MRRPLFHFDAEKAVNAILWIAKRVSDPTFHRISKLMYFADKAHLQKYGRLICGDTYVAMKHGPVPSEIYDMLKAVRGDGFSGYLSGTESLFAVEAGKNVVPLRDANPEVFSESDIECLNEAVEKYGHLSFQELTNESHDEAWKAVDDNDVMDVEQIIATLPDGEALLEHLRDSAIVQQK